MQVGTEFKALNAYEKTYEIIHSERGLPSLWPSDYLVPQIDLFRLHHFDNFARSTSLKVLEFNMRSANIGELPHTPGTDVPLEMLDELIAYNCHDVDETEQFYHHSLEKIEFREKLCVDLSW